MRAFNVHTALLLFLQACAHTSRVLVGLADTITCTLQATSLSGTTFSPCTTGHHCACSRATRRTSDYSTASPPRARRATSCRGQTHQSGSPPTSRRRTRLQFTTELTCSPAPAHAHAQMFVCFCSFSSTCTSFRFFQSAAVAHLLWAYRIDQHDVVRRNYIYQNHTCMATEMHWPFTSSHARNQK
jgi:hypothetical protein